MNKDWATVAGQSNHIWEHCAVQVVDEMIHSLTKHGIPTSHPLRGVCHLAEEVGEVAEEATTATHPMASQADSISALGRMIKELNQVAAYAMLLRWSMEQQIKWLHSNEENSLND